MKIRSKRRNVNRRTTSRKGGNLARRMGNTAMKILKRVPSTLRRNRPLREYNYYACCVDVNPIGQGGFKSVYGVTRDLNRAIDESITFRMTNSQAENSVFIVPTKQILNAWNKTLEISRLEIMNNFEKEMDLYEEFNRQGLAPRVLFRHINKQDTSSKFFALVERCAFDVHRNKFDDNYITLKTLFDRTAVAGYIYTDLKRENICIKNGKYLFVDFDTTFCYTYRNRKKKHTFTVDEISDIMEFMFLCTELNRCPENNQICSSHRYIRKRIYTLIDKYSRKGRQLIQMGGLLDMENAPLIDSQPIHVLAHYLYVNPYLPRNNLINKVIKLIQTPVMPI